MPVLNFHLRRGVIPLLEDSSLLLLNTKSITIWCITKEFTSNMIILKKQKGFWDFAIQYFLDSWHTGHIAINNSMDLSNPQQKSREKQVS